jgi:hypothetical protein
MMAADAIPTAAVSPLAAATAGAAAPTPVPQAATPSQGLPMPAYGTMMGSADGTVLGPDTMLRLMGALDDPEARRHKFIGALLQGTHSGSTGESFGNAYAAMGDFEQQQLKLRAEYMPLMLQQINTMNTQTREWDKARKAQYGAANDAFTSAVGSLGPKATDADVFRVVMGRQQAGDLPPDAASQFLQQYMHQRGQGAAPGDIARSYVLTQLPPAERAERLDPTRKPVSEGGHTAFVPASGSWLTPPNAQAPSAAQPHSPMPTQAELKVGADGGFWITDPLTNKAAPMNSDEGKRIAAEHPEAWMNYISKLNTGRPGTPATPPPAPPGAPVTAPPAGPPPRPGVLPSAPAGAGGAAPPVITPPAGPPSTPGRLSNGPQAAQGGPGAPPVAVPGVPGAPGAPIAAPQPVVNAQQPTPPPGLRIFDGGRTYDGVPPSTLSLAGAAPGGIDPVLKEQALGQQKQFQGETETLAKTVSQMQTVALRADAIRQAVLNVPTGATAVARGDLGKWVSDIARFIPGIRPEEAKAWGDKIVGGDLTALQEFQKMAISGAMVDLRADQGTGQRNTQGEFNAYLNAVANPTLDPGTISKLQQAAQIQRDVAQKELAARLAWARQGPYKVDLNSFNGWWQDYAQRSGAMPPPAVASGLRGKGTEYYFFKAPDGTRMAVSPNIVYPQGHSKAGQPVPMVVNGKILGDYNAQSAGQ